MLYSNKMSGTKDVELGDVKVKLPLKAVEMLYEELKKVIGNGSLSRSNVVVVLLSLMRSVEQYDDVNGVQKKEMILNALNHLISDQIRDPIEAMELKLLVQLTLPTVIDTFVSIDKKELQIKLKKGCSKLFSCCRQ